jgi:hypothetical protein
MVAWNFDVKSKMSLETFQTHDRVDVPNFLLRLLVLIGHLYFEFYVVWCGSENGCREDVCLKEIRLHALKYDIYSWFNN